MNRRVGIAPEKKDRMLRPARIVAASVIAFLVIGVGVAAWQVGVARSAGLPRILPAPQHEDGGGVQFPLTGTVTVVVGDGTDEPAKALLERTIATAGGSAQFVTTAPDTPALYLGTSADNPAIDAARDGIGLQSPAGMPAEGYVLGSGTVHGRKALVLSGVDAAGTYYAVQTLTQIVQDGVVPAVTVRDWPSMPVRGVLEGFYGIPWSHQARLDDLAFAGEHKLNTYVYTPKDDPYLRAKWRELYPDDEVDRLRELVDAAAAHHVSFTFALSPGNDICYSSDEDFDATVAKLDQLRELGVTSFIVPLDDIPLAFRCQSDKDEFTQDGAVALAAAQTLYLNRLVDEYIAPNHLKPLQTVPTYYAGSKPDGYKTEFGETLDPSVRVLWTGEGVFTDVMTLDSVQAAQRTYHTKHLLIWDNFPVTDQQRDRLFLNPLEGRDRNLASAIDGMYSNPMTQSYASMIALAGYADYTWNPRRYDAPTTQSAILDELAGPKLEVRRALAAFVDLNQNWQPYRPSSASAPALSADVQRFWAAYAAGDRDGQTALRDRLATIQALPQTLRGMAQPGFADDADPWIQAAAHWASALQHEIDALTAIRDGQGELATEAMLAAYDERDEATELRVPDIDYDGSIIPAGFAAKVGDGVFEQFSGRVTAVYDSWLAAAPVSAPGPYTARGKTSMEAEAGHPANRMVDGKPDTQFSSDAPPTVGDWVGVDLGSVKSVGSVRIRQSDSDDPGGDLIESADLRYSADGRTWHTATHVEDATTIAYAFDEPVKARYVRLVATEESPEGRWVQTREFQVMPPLTAAASDLVPQSRSSGVLKAFDGKIATAFVATAEPEDGSYLERRFTKPTRVGSVTLVGTAAGILQYEDADGWHDVARVDPGLVFQEARLDRSDVRAVRVAFTPAPSGEAPRMFEFVVREQGPIAHDALMNG